MTMTMADTTNQTLAPASSFIKFDDDGRPFIEAHRCGTCGAVFTEPRVACARCTSRGGFTPIRASDRGTLYTFTVVQRSYPGVKVPFISAIVDLEDGVVLKGNLIDVNPDPATIPFGMRVRVVFGDANGQTTKDGTPYVSYFFTPDCEQAS